MHHLLPIAALIATTLATVSVAGPLACFEGGKVCFQAAPSVANANVVDVLVQHKVTRGWVAVGYGPGMTNADMIMLWQNPNGDWTASRRFSTGAGLPAAAPANLQSAVRIVNATRSPNAAGNHQILLQRPVARTSNAAGDVAVTSAAQAMSYAYYEGSGVSATNLPRHNGLARFTYNSLDASVRVDLSKPAVPTTQQQVPSGPASAEEAEAVAKAELRHTAVLVHGILMAVAWSVISFTAIFFARFMKGKLPSKWFPIHRALFLLAIVMTIVAFGLVVGTNSSGDHFTTTHGLIGFLVFIASLLQLILGFVIDKLFDPARTKVPFHDKLHWIAGYFLAVAAPVNVVLGHLSYETPTALFVVNLVVFGLYVALFAVGQARFGQTHEHKEKP
ncbi:hypothetical protein H9P43_007103 [Blastocladiella emersonii ATCC 22665]|nr:hypothetical protein H9P43_007103 [Blastocladiella emersonii ATCC 22665]